MDYFKQVQKNKIPLHDEFPRLVSNEMKAGRQGRNIKNKKEQITSTKLVPSETSLRSVRTTCEEERKRPDPFTTSQNKTNLK